jgi:hypothetical protein
MIDRFIDIAMGQIPRNDGLGCHRSARLLIRSRSAAK